MPRFAANLTMMFTEVPFLQRFGRAAAAGFQAVEFLFPYAHAPEAIAAELDRHRLTLALFNMPPGDWSAGERGMAAIPGREQQFRDQVETALQYAQALGCRRLHAMAGITKDLPADACAARFVENFRHAADRLALHGITLLAEPINSRSMPGYFLTRQDQALTLLDRVDRANAALQLDLFHAQIMEGDLTMLIRRLKGRFDHVQIASVPERHEPDGGEVNWPYLFALLDAEGYDGWVGCEYNPRAATENGLRWFAPWRQPR